MRTCMRGSRGCMWCWATHDRCLSWRAVAAILDDGPADAIVSGLGLLTMPPSLQREILAAAFDCLRADGVFVQFTYGPAAPVADAVVRQLELKVRRGDFVLRNVPPATVYVYSRHAPDSGHD